MIQTDYQLIQEYKQTHDGKVFKEFFERYEPTLKLYAYKMYKCFKRFDPSMDFLHHMSELSLYFLIAVDSCNLNKVKENFDFKKRLHYYLRSYNQTLHKYFSTKKNKYLVDREQDMVSTVDIIDCGRIDESFSKIEDKLFIDTLLISLKTVLNTNEMAIIYMILEGKNVAEMAEQLEFTRAWIYMLLSDIVRKIKVQLPEVKFPD